MSNLHTSKRWISLAVVPLFSMAVLAGCSSDDDDDGAGTPIAEVPDGSNPADAGPADIDGDGVADAFQSSDTTIDTNGNTIIDAFEASDTDADENGNGINDVFEAELTGGEDLNNDGIDDAAAASLDEDTPVVAVEPIDQTGELNPITLSNGAGIGNFVWDGVNLSGSVSAAENVQINSVSIQSGIFAVGTSGQQVLVLNGSSPTFSTPTPIDSNIAAVIAENIVGGNLFINAQLSDGNNGQGTILLPGVEAAFANLASDNVIPTPETSAFSGGAGSINVNTVTGDIAAAVRVDINPSDVDGSGNSQTATQVSINAGAADATGPIIATLTLGTDGFFTVVQQLSQENLAALRAGETYFEVLGTDGNGFIRGQIPAIP